MGKVLLKFGVRAVIVVRAEVGIRDRVATKAGSYIYNELVNGKSIRQAVEDFKDFLKNTYPHLCYICCCEHEHDPKCPWKLKKESANLSWEQVAYELKGS